MTDRVDPSGTVNAGLDAGLNSSLEQLSQLVNFTALQQPDGSEFSVSLTAQDIFDNATASQNVFSSINNLRQALLSNNAANITSALADVQTSGAFLNQQLAFYGTVQDRVTSASNYAKNYETQFRTQLSGIQDADEAQAITDLTQAQTEQQAALLSRAQLPRTSLFDYLA